MYVVFDIGGSQTRVGVSRNGKALDEVMDKVTQVGYPAGLRLLLGIIENLTDGGKIEAIAGGVAGVWDKNKSKIVKSPNLPDWENKNIKRDLEDKLGCKVILENDAALGGLGEAVYGSGENERRVAYLACGTGVGGSLISNKNIIVAGEPGHQLVGSLTLEQLIGGRSLQMRYGKRVEEIADERVWEEIVNNLAVGIVNVTVMWVPDVIVLGGSLAKSIDLERLKTAVSQRQVIYPWVPKVVKAQLADQAGLWGGLALLDR